jgi:hypothetical protein
MLGICYGVLVFETAHPSRQTRIGPAIFRGFASTVRTLYTSPSYASYPAFSSGFPGLSRSIRRAFASDRA